VCCLTPVGYAAAVRRADAQLPLTLSLSQAGTLDLGLVQIAPAASKPRE
jgi:hypothetical protein